MRLDLTKLTAAGFEFDTVQAKASGTPRRIALELASDDGQPLAFELELQGSAAEGWLVGLAAASRVRRQGCGAPASARAGEHRRARKAAEFRTRAWSMAASSCACKARCSRTARFTASYSLANLPLALANALATRGPADQVRGHASKARATFRRDAEGKLFGDVHRESDSGSMSRTLAVAGRETQPAKKNCWLIDDFRSTRPRRARMHARVDHARLQANGTLHGEASVSQPGQHAGSMRSLERESARSCAARCVRAAARQRSRQHRRASQCQPARCRSRSSSGLVTAAELAADIPAIGLHLKNGQLRCAADVARRSLRCPAASFRATAR